MQTLRISRWPDDTGLEHESTSWQISDKTDFLTIFDESLEDDVFKDIWYSNIVIPIGSEFYGRSKRHFTNGTTTDWVGPIKLLAAESGDNLDLKPEVHIEEPSVSLKVFENGCEGEEEPHILISAGSFRCKTDGHKSTNWVLKDGLGNILFRSLYNEVNKREIKIFKSTLNINNTNSLIAEVSYITTNDYESHFGYKKLPLGKFKFEVNSNTSFIPTNLDYIFKFTSLLTGDDYVLSNYIIKDSDKNVIQEASFETDDYRIVIDRELLKPSKTYSIEMYQSDLPNDVKIIKFFTNRSSLTYAINKNYKYEEAYIDTGLTYAGLKQTTSEQFVDNGVPMSVGDNGYIKIFHLDRKFNNLTISDLPMRFLELDITDKFGTNIVSLDSSRILIDSKSEDGTDNNVFRIFDYNFQRSLGTVVRTDESTNINITNGLTVDPAGKSFYFAKVSNNIVLRSLDTATLEIETLTTRPDIVSLDATLIYIGNDKLLSFNGSDEKDLVYIYDINDDSWNDVSIVPEKFRDLALTTYIRKDGKTVSFNTGDGTNNSLIFDPEHNSFKDEVNSLNDEIILDSVVRLRGGEFIRYNSAEEEGKIYLYR